MVIIATTFKLIWALIAVTIFSVARPAHDFQIRMQPQPGRLMCSKQSVDTDEIVFVAKRGILHLADAKINSNRPVRFGVLSIWP